MARDFNKYAAMGEKRLRTAHYSYDLYASEIYALMDKADRSTTDLYEVITACYNAGFEAGARMITNKKRARH